MAASGQDRIERRLAAILAADVADYSRLTGVDAQFGAAACSTRLRMTAPAEDALQLQRPLADGSLQIVARDVKEDSSEAEP